MLREVGFILIYLASCVVCEKALGKHDENILKTFGGPTLIIVIAFCALVSFIRRFICISIYPERTTDQIKMLILVCDS
jgi:uncharacterized membrane protein YcfT